MELQSDYFHRWRWVFIAAILLVTDRNCADEPSDMGLRTCLTNSVPQSILSRIHLSAMVNTQAVHAVRFMRFRLSLD